MRLLNKKYNIEYHPITRNRDEKGVILTYNVHLPNLPRPIETNTLKQARVLAYKMLREKK